MRYAHTLGIMLAVAFVACAPRLEPVSRHIGAHEHTVETPDGWQLGVIHLPPTERPRPGQAPVILAHATACNTRNYDLLERSSLARHLARAGFDVWVVEWRGGPLGARPRTDGRVKRGHFNAFTERQYDWDFDTLVNVDAPAIVKRVQRWSGHQEVHWLGHSLGGMVGWAADARATVTSFRSLIAVGSPASYGHPHALARKAGPVMGVMPLMGGLPARNSMARVAPLKGLIPAKLLGSAMNMDNMEPAETDLIFRALFEDSPRGLMLQYKRWIERGEVVSRDGRFSYTQALPQVRTPLLALSGRADRIAPPWTVYPLYAYASSREKRWHTFGVAEGNRIDYGHLDLLLGKNAPEEVFPLIQRWLEEH
ncbi:MAG: alpha/beta fold hydrolase [Myxococcota bacterium]